MKFSTVAKQFGIASLAMAVAVGCSSNAKKDEDAAKAAAMEASEQVQAEADAAAAAAQAEADRLAAAAAQAEADARAQAAAASQGTVDYIVTAGDSLWSIAGQGQTYGNPYAWPLIYKANKAQIKDADLIFAGQNFAIDTAISGVDMDAAVQHAKTRGAWSVGAVEASDSDYLAR
jgi:nucleoid-associated protein YgaU